MSRQIVYSRTRQSSTNLRVTNRYCYCNQLVVSSSTCRCQKTLLDSTNKTTAMHPSRDSLRTARLDKFQTKYDHDKEVFKAKEEEKRRKKLEDKLKRYQGVGELGNKMVACNLSTEEKNDGYWNSRNSYELQYQNDSDRFQNEQLESFHKEERKKHQKLEEKLKRNPGIGDTGNKMVESYLTREEKIDGYVNSRKSFELQYQHDSNEHLLEKSEREEKELPESLKHITPDKATGDDLSGKSLGDKFESRLASPNSSVIPDLANNNCDNNAVASSSISSGKQCTSSEFKEVSSGVASSGNKRLTKMNRASKEHSLLIQKTKNKPISSDNLKTGNSAVKVSSPNGSVEYVCSKSSYGIKTGNSSGKNSKSSSVTSLTASDSNCHAVIKMAPSSTTNGKRPKGSSVFSLTSSGIVNDKKPDSSIPIASSLDDSHSSLHNSNVLMKVAPLDTVGKKKLRTSSVFTKASSNALDDKSNDVIQVTPPSDTTNLTPNDKSRSVFNVTSLAASDRNLNAVIMATPSNTTNGKKPKGSSVFSLTSSGTLNDKKLGGSMPVALSLDTSHGNANTIMKVPSSNATIGNKALDASHGNANTIMKVAPLNATVGNKPKGSSVFAIASRDASCKNLNGNTAEKDISVGSSNLTLSGTSDGCRLGGNLVNRVRGEHPLLAKLTKNTLLS